MHLFDAPHNFYGGNAIVGGGLPLAVGLALADHMRGEDARHRLLLRRRRGRRRRVPREPEPGRALGAAGALRLREQSLRHGHGARAARNPRPTSTDKAESYRIAAEAVDGMDVVAVEAAARRAVAQIRATGKPYFLECRTYRFRAHSMFDAQLYRDKAEVEAWRSKGPIVALPGLGAGERAGPSRGRRRRSRPRSMAEIDAAVAFAEAGAWEPVEDLTRYVYAPERPAPPAPAAPSRREPSRRPIARRARRRSARRCSATSGCS